MSNPINDSCSDEQLVRSMGWKVHVAPLTSPVTTLIKPPYLLPQVRWFFYCRTRKHRCVCVIDREHTLAAVSGGRLLLPCEGQPRKLETVGSQHLRLSMCSTIAAALSDGAAKVNAPLRPAVTGRVPRAARLMALVVRCEGMIGDGA